MRVTASRASSKLRVTTTGADAKYSVIATLPPADHTRRSRHCSRVRRYAQICRARHRRPTESTEYRSVSSEQPSQLCRAEHRSRFLRHRSQLHGSGDPKGEDICILRPGWNVALDVLCCDLRGILVEYSVERRIDGSDPFATTWHPVPFISRSGMIDHQPDDVFSLGWVTVSTILGGKQPQHLSVERAFRCERFRLSRWTPRP